MAADMSSGSAGCFSRRSHGAHGLKCHRQDPGLARVVSRVVEGRCVRRYVRGVRCLRIDVE
jgi:hypothetical protein